MADDYNYLADNRANPLPESFYEALAWQGLKEHNVKAYKNLPDSKKAELANNLNAHYHSTTKTVQINYEKFDFIFFAIT